MDLVLIVWPRRGNNANYCSCFCLGVYGLDPWYSMHFFTIINDSLLWLRQVIYKSVIIDHAVINILIHTILVLFWYFF